MSMATVKQVVRYPVKSMQGEQMESANIREYGVEGDRLYGWERKDEPGHYLTIPSYPFLLEYDVHLEEAGELAFGQGPHHYTSREAVDAASHISARAGTEVSLAKADLTVDKPNYWDEPLLVTTTSSLEKLQEWTGRDSLDMLRFRPNLVLELDEKTPFLEESWIGKEVTINDVVIQVNKGCKRCAYVNVDSTTLEVDPSVLKTVVKENEMIFGVYATVKQPGTVRVGSRVHLTTS